MIAMTMMVDRVASIEDDGDQVHEMKMETSRRSPRYIGPTQTFLGVKFSSYPKTCGIKSYWDTHFLSPPRSLRPKNLETNHIQLQPLT
ncbi:hypothetical protein QVD17_03899 [Tagetes erecta]|uniref:Uncharacterized protein n=1 Tax=Tagetes erecta TaxID=13708 RepID=A0AAD8LF93_TARER|nr:hypothetical protein QVD17_03899 [Tagetes erecta]